MKLLCALCLLVSSAALAGNDALMLRRFLNYRSLTRVTEAQIDVEASVATFCRDPKEIHGPHIRPGICIPSA